MTEEIKFFSSIQKSAILDLTVNNYCHLSRVADIIQKKNIFHLEFD